MAKAVSTKKIYQWNDGLIWKTTAKPPRPQSRLHVVAYDFGIKRNILRILAEHGCRMTVVPAQTPADQVLAMNPDGIFLANGPGDPEPCDYAITGDSRVSWRRTFRSSASAWDISCWGSRAAPRP